MTVHALKEAVKSGSWEDFVNAVESFFKKDLGYVKVKLCECIDEPSSEEKKRLKEKADCYQKRFHRKYSPDYNEKLYATHVRCLHYRHPRIEEGLISVIEGNREMTDYILMSVQQSLRKGLEFGGISKRLQMGAIGVLALANQERKNIYQAVNPEIMLGNVNFYAYGDKHKGKMETTEFECKDGKKWGEEMGLPQVVKSVSLSQIQISNSI